MHDSFPFRLLGRAHSASIFITTNEQIKILPPAPLQIPSDRISSPLSCPQAPPTPNPSSKPLKKTKRPAISYAATRSKTHCEHFVGKTSVLTSSAVSALQIIHMRDMYSTVIDIHRLRQKEHKLQQHHQYQHQQHQRHRSSTFSRDGAAVDVRAFGLESAARLAGNSLLSFSRAASVGGGGAEEEVEEEAVVLLGGGEEEEELCRQREQARLDCSLAGLLAPLYKDRPFYSQQGRSHHYHLHQQHHHQWSVDSDGGGGGGHHARSIVSSSISAFTLPVIKLNNCVIDEPEMEAITEEERGGADKSDPERRGPPAGLMESLAVPAPSLAKASKPPGLHRSNSASSSDSSCCSPASPSRSPTSACWLSPGAARTDLGSNSSLHVLGGHSKSLDLERGPGTLSVRPEQRKHPSWPRLDRSNSGSGGGGGGKGYVRLQDREDHGEGRLLDVPPCAASTRDYSKREKLLMISRSHNNLTFEHDDFNSSALKLGSSETRF